MVLYLIIDIVVGFLFLALAVVSLIYGGYRHTRNRLFVGFSLCLLAWLVSNQISSTVDTPEKWAIIANYVLFASSIAATILMTKLVVMLLDSKVVNKLFAILEPVAWVIAVISATPLVGSGVEDQGRVYGVTFGPAVWAYGGALLVLLAILAFAITLGWNNKNKSRRGQIRTIGAALILACPLVLSLGFLIPYFTNNFEISQISLTPLIILAVAIFQAIVRHGLFDIKSAAVRTVAYILSITTLATVYFSLAYMISAIAFRGDATRGTYFSPVSVVLALVLAILFQPIKKFFDKYTDKVFYRSDYLPEVFYGELNRVLVSTTDLRNLLQRISQLLSTTFKADQVLFMVYFDKDKSRYMTAGTKARSDIPKSDAILLDERMRGGHSRVIVTDILGVEDDKIRRMLVSHRVALTIPIGIDNSISGYLMLGERLSGDYTSKDLTVLNTIINELAIAIQNVVSIHAVKKLNATLQQRIDVATKELQSSNAQLKRLDSVKDEFMSMASHQLRTPLTSIKGYLSMVLEGDAGRVDARQKKLLLEAFRSSERMVGLIADFLNVSRIQTGRFVLDNRYFDLVETVESEVGDLSILAESHDIKLRLTVAKNMTAPVYGDESKLQQVIMNFVDNAIYYSKAKSTVVIRITKSTDTVSVRVVDTGIGVPAEEQKRLFNKFFRAKNARKARPDGTGVGLYLARRVVAAHGGQLIFSSKEDKGSTFGFTIPLKEPPVEDKEMSKPVQTTTKLD